MIRSFLKHVPVPTAGLALGIVALGKLMGTWLPYAESVCVFLSVVLILLVTAKAFICPVQLRADLQQPVQAAVFGTFFMTYMQLATYLSVYHLRFAQALWAIAVIGQFALMVWFSASRMRSPKLQDVFATWFVCYVGIIVGSVTSPAVQMIAVGQGLFCFGFVAYVILLVLVTLRYIRHEVPAPAAPTFCIYAAPMSLSLAGYMAVCSNPNIWFVLCLEVFAQLLFYMVLLQVPKFIRSGFFPSFAAMTFPFVITATALQGSLSVLRSAGIMLPLVFDIVLYCECIFACGMTLFVLVCFGRFFVQKLRVVRDEHNVAYAS